MSLLTAKDVETALKRIESYTKRTPILRSESLNKKLGHEIFFKAECLQTVGAFKARGALNALLSFKEKNRLPQQVVCYSSGNHAQGVAWACALFKVPCEVFMPEFSSLKKQQATTAYGAKVILTKTRQEAETQAQEAAEKGALLIPPFDDDQVICGQGTLFLEAKDQIEQKLDAVFAPCGGGGLLSGIVIAASALKNPPLVFGGEPLNANDAVRSLREGKIYHFTDSPDTIADGVKTLSVSERTFQYLKRLSGIFEITEEEIISWTRQLTDYLKVTIEPTAALGMAAAEKWLSNQKKKQKVLVVLSGGNMDDKTKVIIAGVT